MIELLLEAERALGKGRIDQAEYLYRQAAIADPRNSIAVVGLGRVALERDDEAEAWRQARRALEIDPENAAAIRMIEVLEDVWQRSGRALPESEANGVVLDEPHPGATIEPPIVEPVLAEEVPPEPEPVGEPDPEPEALSGAAEVGPEPEPEAVHTAVEPDPAAADVEAAVIDVPPAPEPERPPAAAELEPEPEPEPAPHQEPAAAAPEVEPAPEPEPANGEVAPDPEPEPEPAREVVLVEAIVVEAIEAPPEPEPDGRWAATADASDEAWILEPELVAEDGPPEPSVEARVAEPGADEPDEVHLDASVIAAAHAWEAAVAGVAEPETAVEELVDGPPSIDEWPAADLVEPPAAAPPTPRLPKDWVPSPAPAADPRPVAPPATERLSWPMPAVAPEPVPETTHDDASTETPEPTSATGERDADTTDDQDEGTHLGTLPAFDRVKHLFGRKRE